MDQAIIELRDATPDDADEVARVHEEAWRFAYQGIIPHFHLQRMIANRRSGWWTHGKQRSNGMLLLTFNGTPQGYVAFGKSRFAVVPNAGEIFELYLAPAYMGVGFGKRMFLAARQRLAKSGRRGLLVWALAENEPACAFYQHLGGERFAAIPERYGDVTLQRIAFLWPHKSGRRRTKD